MTKTKIQPDADFVKFLAGSYPEHKSRIGLARFSAKFVVIIYPAATLCVMGVMSFILVKGLELAKTSEMFGLLKRIQGADAQAGQTAKNILEVAPSWTEIGCISLTILATLWMLGVALNKARDLRFEAEKWELSVRLDFALRNMSSHSIVHNESNPEPILSLKKGDISQSPEPVNANENERNANELNTVKCG